MICLVIWFVYLSDLIVNYMYRKYGVPFHNFFLENWTRGTSHLKFITFTNGQWCGPAASSHACHVGGPKEDVAVSAMILDTIWVVKFVARTPAITQHSRDSTFHRWKEKREWFDRVFQHKCISVPRLSRKRGTLKLIRLSVPLSVCLSQKL